MRVRILPNGPDETSEVFTADYREAAPGLDKTMYVDNIHPSRVGSWSTR